MLGDFRSIGTQKNLLLVNLSLFVSFFCFYYIFSLHVIPAIGTKEVSTFQALFSYSIIIALLFISPFISKTTEKERVIIPCVCIPLAILFSFFVTSLAVTVICVIIVGSGFAVGQLAAYTHFWRTTNAEQRGRISGIISFLGLPLYFILSNFLAASSGSIGLIMLCFFLCCLAIVSVSIGKTPVIKEHGSRGEYYPEKRTIVLYSIPWIIFTFVNATFAKNISEITSILIVPSLYNQLIIVQTIAALIGALFGGCLADYVGRRLTMVLSVTLYGVSMTLRGLINSDFLCFFGFAVEGLSWGIILTLYIFIIWGDLSNRLNCSKIYAIGLSVFYFFTGLGLTNFFVIDSLATNTLISCLLIFLSIIPIVLSPELLSLDTRSKRRLEGYIKNVKKVVENNQKS